MARRMNNVNGAGSYLTNVMTEKRREIEKTYGDGGGDESVAPQRQQRMVEAKSETAGRNVNKAKGNDRRREKETKPNSKTAKASNNKGKGGANKGGNDRQRRQEAGDDEKPKQEKPMSAADQMRLQYYTANPVPFHSIGIFYGRSEAIRGPGTADDMPSACYAKPPRNRKNNYYTDF